MEAQHSIVVHRNGSQLPARREEQLEATVQPVADLFEQGYGYVIRLDLPGVPREAVDVRVGSGQLSVRASVPPLHSHGARVVHREIAWNRFERAFNLGPDVDAEGITATYADGVLTVLVPKSDRDRLREIPIS